MKIKENEVKILFTYPVTCPGYVGILAKECMRDSLFSLWKLIIFTVGSLYKWNLSSADSNENDIRIEHCQRQRKATIWIWHYQHLCKKVGLGF